MVEYKYKSIHSQHINKYPYKSKIHGLKRTVVAKTKITQEKVNINKITQE